MLGIISEKDNATAAELIWSMKVASSHLSYASFDDIKETFEAMFPGAVPKNFSLCSSKVSYMISDALGPYFHKILIDDIKLSNSLIVLLHDETTNAQHLKQLDIQVRYWSKQQEQVEVHHLQIFLWAKPLGSYS